MKRTMNGGVLKVGKDIELPKRTFLLDYEIDEGIWSEIMIPLMEADRKSKKPITILLNCLGGTVYDGMAAINTLQSIKTPMRVVVLGYAYSMAALMTMALKTNPWAKVYAYPFSSMLIHGGSTVIQGTTSQVKDYQQFADKYEQLIKEFMLSSSSLTEEDYEKIERHEKYYTAQEMLEAGFIHEIVPFGVNLFNLPVGDGQ